MEPVIQQIDKANAKLKTIEEIGFQPPSGKRFLYWTTDRDGEDPIRYEDGATIDFTESKTLYAQWGEDQCKVTWDSRGGTSVDPYYVGRGSAISEEYYELPVPTRSEYSFQGWYTDISGGAQVALNSVISEDVTYYAQWTGLTRTMVPLWMRFDNGLSNEQDLFNNLPKGTYDLKIQKMKITHEGRHSSHRLMVAFMSYDPNGNFKYLSLPATTRLSTTSNVSRDSVVLGESTGTRTVYVVKATGLDREESTPYFTLTTTVTLPYSKNRLVIRFFPGADGESCEGRLIFTQGTGSNDSDGLVTLTKKS